MLASSTISVPVPMRVSIQCELNAVRPVARKLRDFISERGVTEDDAMACELAFVEACNNAVLYAAENKHSLPIEIQVSCGEEQIEIAIRDHTDGFDLPETVTLPEHINESGRGLFIIRSLMDETSYERGANGNTMRLVKRRSNALLHQSRFSTDEIAEYKRKLRESEQVIGEMAEELSSCYESLSAIFRCGAELGKTNDINDFAVALCHDLLQITESDWFVLRVASEENHSLIPFATSNPAEKFGPLALSSSIVSVEIKAAKDRQDVWFSAKNPISANDPLHPFGGDCTGLVHPLFFADNLSGTLTVGKYAGRPAFTAAQANIVHTFADFLAIQFINARLQQEQLEHKLVSRELEIAKSIQRALLPRTLPRLGRFELAGYCEFARTVGGDFYDVVPVGHNSVLLVIADVMGKGIPAAMFAAILRSVLRAAPELNQKPEALLHRVNRLLYEELSEVDMFITAQLVFVDFTERKLIAASAGHCPMLLGSPGSKELKAISPDGIPLGILPEAEFAAQIEQLPPQARLLLYTDGMTDARNSDGAFFSEERLLSWFCNSVQTAISADELKHSLVDSLHKFQGDAAPFDDQTFLILAEQNSERRANVPENFSC